MAPGREKLSLLPSFLGRCRCGRIPLPQGWLQDARMDAAPRLALGTGHRPQTQPRAACRLLQQGPTHLPHLQHPSSPCLLDQTLCFEHALGAGSALRAEHRGWAVPTRRCASIPELPAASSQHPGSAQQPSAPGSQPLPNTAHLCPWPSGPPRATGSHRGPPALPSPPALLPRALAVSTRCPGPGLVISLTAHRRAA